MTIENDETLQIYLEESLEHLADIENDFLEIERAGANIDEDLVNKVYRAAHSIKGGAGFMGLTIIKDLTHEMENILGKIRSRELIPNPEIINILLMASDALKELIEDVFNSNNADISQHLTALKAIAEGTPHPAENAPEDSEQFTKNTPAEAVSSPEPVSTSEPDPDDHFENIEIPFPDGRAVLRTPKEALDRVRDEGKHIYLVQMDLIRDVHAKKKFPVEVLEELGSYGHILATHVDIHSIGTVDQRRFLEQIPFRVLFASILKPNDINNLFEVDENNIYILTEAMETVCLPIHTAQQQAPVEKEQAPPAPAPDPAPNTKPHAQPATVTAAQKEMAPSASAVEGPVPPTPVKEKTFKDTKISASAPAEETNKASCKELPTATETSLRVNVSLLDSLMNLAGELVLSRNQLLQAISTNDQRASENAGQRVDLITSELQETIMLTRMQAIGNVFNKFPRVVRDLARKMGKEVEITLEGNDVEMDKTIIEAISEPLTHLVRNSVDHGIETPDARLESGKAPRGHVKLRAYHEAGQVNIEIIDDGKGLNGKKLADTALAKGLISEEQAATMSDKEKTHLIFLPGFSTADRITDVSGRGVGMDVVKTNLDKLGGVIDIDSEPGHGTSIRIKLPLTLAIIPSQIIYAGKERYAIPQVNLEELLRISAAHVKERIEQVGNAKVVRLRGNLLPLVKLADVIEIDQTYIDLQTNEESMERRKSIADRRCRKSPLRHEGPPANPSAQTPPERDEGIEQRSGPQERRYHTASALNIVVVSTGSMKYGLVVDELYDSEEIVVKPLGRHLKQCKGYAGATIMGDGKVALILDVGNLAKMARLTSLGGTDRATEVTREAKETGDIITDKQSLLVFRNAAEEQFVVPLNQVERIEKIKRFQIEHVGSKKVLQYRGGSLPLFSIDQVAHVKPLEETKELLVIVFNIAKRSVGLMAMGPVDVMELYIDFDEDTVRQPGILGSAIINNQTTLLVDIYGIVQTLNPEWFNPKQKIETNEGKRHTILVVEDSNFFRNQVKGYMEENGYDVIVAEDGIDAWDKLTEHADQVSLVCTDIEMPNLDGFGLTEKIRENNRFDSLPVLALTTLAADEDITKGKNIGIDEYHIKLDKERLMQSVQDYLIHGRYH